jgi:hypothetical protein
MMRAMLLLVLLTAACSRTPLLPLTAAQKSNDAGTDGDPSRAGRASTDFTPRDLETPVPRPCGKLEEIEVRNLDLLFMVDNSGSMKEEQTALRRELPRMIERLTSGDTDGDGKPDMRPIVELHLGVVSSNMGLVGIVGIDKCMGLGDDAVLQHTPSFELSDCAPSYPSFLTYRSANGDSAQTASDFACISTLGTDGCGFEQPLEAVLKALWPSNDDRITFLPDPQGEGARGRGDTDNAGFLRPTGGTDTSLVAVVLVSDEDDCSSKNTAHLRPPAFLDPARREDRLLLTQGLNVRCELNPDHLHAVSRYVDGLQALRPDSQGLVVLGAIVGVPTALVAPEALAAVDLADPVQREAFYERLLADPMMQQRVDTLGTDSPDDDRMLPSCESPNGLAYPPVRIVETARAFGRDAIVQSICQDDFGPAIDAILGAISRASAAACIAR